MNVRIAQLAVFVILGLFSAPVGAEAQQVEGDRARSTEEREREVIDDPCRPFSEEEKRRYLAQQPPPPPGLSCPGYSYWNGKGCTTGELWRREGPCSSRRESPPP